MLKAASANNAAFIDNLSSRFVHVLQKVCREQPQTTNSESSMGISELVIQSLDLMKNRVSNMHIDTRKTFIGTILVGLIEKTNDARIMKTILKVCIINDYINIINIIPIHFIKGLIILKLNRIVKLGSHRV